MSFLIQNLISSSNACTTICCQYKPLSNQNSLRSLLRKIVASACIEIVSPYGLRMWTKEHIHSFGQLAFRLYERVDYWHRYAKPSRLCQSAWLWRVQRNMKDWPRTSSCAILHFCVYTCLVSRADWHCYAKPRELQWCIIITLMPIAMYIICKKTTRSYDNDVVQLTT